MRAHIEYDIREGGYKVFLFDRSWIYRLDERGRLVHGERRGEGTTIEPAEPTLRIDADALAMIVAEAGKVLQASDATVDALNDTRQVRDRLLVLVEKAFD